MIKIRFCFLKKNIGREHIIVPLDRRFSQLKSSSSGRYRLPYFVYTGLFYTGLFYTGTLFYTGRG